MEQIAADSAKAVKTLAKASSQIAAQLHDNTNVGYLVVTVERTSGFVYTPISNLSAALLGALDEKFAADLVGSVREENLFPLSERGHVRELCDYIRKTPELLPIRKLFVLPIDGKGRRRAAAAVFDSSAQEDPNASNELDAYFANHPDLFMADEWRKRLNRLRQEGRVRMDGPVEVFFLLRPEPKLNGETGRRARTLDLMQMGFALAAGTTMSVHDARICAEACMVTSVGTLSLLHDKERYYERASRQAATGTVVKHDKAAEIRKQYDFLRKLGDRGALNIPFPLVNESDPELEKKSEDGADRRSWYVMPWVQLPKLSETILRGSEFKKYELGALMRAAVMHLRQDYWTPFGENKRVAVGDLLWSPLLMAQKAIREFTEDAEKTFRQVGGRLPVQHSQGVTVHDPAKWEQSRPAIEAMVGKDTFKIKLHWNSDNPLWIKQVVRPEEVLQEVGETLAQMMPHWESRRQRARNVHGDSHFLNLLVDASVPEDPLVISIDPKPLEPPDRTDYQNDYLAQASEKGKQSWASVFDELEEIQHDPVYDVAKYLMSTACFYGLAREGFDLTTQRSGAFQLANKPQVNKPLSDTGGISTARLIRLGSGIPKRSLWNHLTCADAIVREFVQLFLSIRDPQERQVDTNVGLIRLWLLTIRALFSATRTLLPGDLVAGSILYLLTAAYMHDSSSHVLNVLKEEHLQERKTQVILQQALRWRRLADKVERLKDT